MSDGFSAKNELKKTFLTEPVKYVIGILIVTYGAPAIGLLFPAFRELLVQSVPVWILLIAVLLLVSITFLFSFLWVRTRRLLNQSKIAADQEISRDSETEYEPDAVDLQILRQLYHDKSGMTLP